jgi:hypothetical protein
MHAMGGGMRFSGMGGAPRFAGGGFAGRGFAGPGFAGSRFSRAAFAPRFANRGFFPNRFNRFARFHRFRRFSSFAFFGAPFIYASYYDGCWRRVWTGYGPEWVNVCDYGYGWY